MELSDKLKIPIYASAGILMGLDVYHGGNPDFWIPVSHHVGNSFESASFPWLLNHAVDRISNFVPKLNSFTKYFPEVSYGAMALVNIIGEAFYDIIPYNTPQPEDIPAALICCLAGYIYTKSNKV